MLGVAAAVVVMAVMICVRGSLSMTGLGEGVMVVMG